MHRWLTALLILAAPLAAQAGTLERVRASGVVHCGGLIRPGLAFPARDDTWHGIEIDMCRAVAIAALGERAQFEFHAYSLSNSYDTIRKGTEDVFFLTTSEILAERLLPYVMPGRTIFYAANGVMVRADDKAKSLAELPDESICGEPGTGPERTLIAWFAARQKHMSFFPFQETDEMLDAYYADRCTAVVGQKTTLAAFALQAAADRHPSRLLPDTVSAVPLMANTGQADAAWSAIVAWTVDTLLRAETLGHAGPGGGPEPLPLAGPALGLDPAWQTRVVGEVGSYADIYERNLGAGSPLEQPRGLNALWTDGGLMCPPFTE